MSIKKLYGLVLREKDSLDGLTRNDVIDLFDMLNGLEAYPIELEARHNECSAMGFITIESAETLWFDYEKSGLHDFIANILDDLNNENENCEYEYKGVSIYMSRL